MSGHSKWANIKHRKASADARKGKAFSRTARELTVAARQGGRDPDSNIALRTALQKARACNMPSDNVERAIKKGTGELAADVLEEVTYEGYAPGGVAMLVATLTGNRNRSAAEVRSVFTRYGGNLAGVGAVVHLFQRKGQIFLPGAGVDEDRLLELVLEAGADDLKRDGDDFEILADPTAFGRVLDALAAAGLAPSGAELTMLPSLQVPVSELEQARALVRFTEALEDLEDVQNVYANFNIAEPLLEQLGED